MESPVCEKSTHTPARSTNHPTRVLSKHRQQQSRTRSSFCVPLDSTTNNKNNNNETSKGKYNSQKKQRTGHANTLTRCRDTFSARWRSSDHRPLLLMNELHVVDWSILVDIVEIRDVTLLSILNASPLWPWYFFLITKVLYTEKSLGTQEKCGHKISVWNTAGFRISLV